MTRWGNGIFEHIGKTAIAHDVLNAGNGSLKPGQRGRWQGHARDVSIRYLVLRLNCGDRLKLICLINIHQNLFGWRQ